MEELFVSYELAVKLKYAGFKEDCLAFFNDGVLTERNCVGYLINKEEYPSLCTAPTHQQALDWVMRWLSSKYPSSVTIIQSDGSGVWKSSSYRKKAPSLTIEFDDLDGLTDKALKLI